MTSAGAAVHPSQIMSSTDPLAILKDLVEAESVTPDAGAALDAFQRHCPGFSVERPVFEEDGTAPVENLFAAIGTGAPHLTLAGHVDVVPPGEAALWSAPPFALTLRDGAAIGRGTADMKGGLAAMLAAVNRIQASGDALNGRISYLITGDEEGPAVNGTKKLLDWAVRRGERFDACLLGEPTSVARIGDTVKNGRRGSFSATLRVEGTQGHVAYPERADNPIRGLHVLLGALLDPPLDAGSAFFQPSNLEPVSVDVGNPATNVIPARAEARFNVRFNDLWTPETLEAELRGRLERASDGRIRWVLLPRKDNSASFVTEGGAIVEAVIEAIEAETGLKPALSTGGGTSDARFIKDYCPVVEFGLVGATMHMADERIALADLESLTAIYERAIRAFFAMERA